MNYKVYQGTELKQTVTSKTAVMNGLQPNRTYEFGVQPNDGNRDGTKAATSVTTRGIRFNIPKTLTVGSTITLRYEEYPLGIVPIGNEPSGMFGGGSKQNLSAKVISTANGSSVVEVAGNVIDVGNKNLFKNTRNLSSTTTTTPWGILFNSSQIYDSGIKSLSVVSAITFSFNVYVPLNATVGSTIPIQLKGQNSRATNLGTDDYNTIIAGSDNVIKQSDLGKTIRTSFSIQKSPNYQSFDDALADTASITIRQDSGTPGFVYSNMKLEQGDTATPYAAFVDGDTFTAQPDGTCALFSEYKALYY